MTARWCRASRSSTLSGNHAIVRDLAEVWAAAERLCGRPVDPLDPRFIGGGDEAALT